jgi:cytochrome c
MRASVITLAAAGLLAAATASSAAQPAGNAAKGKAVFDQQCKLCHGTAAGQEINAPSLFGVVGRKAAADPGFKSYTPALKGSKLVWSPANLDKFLSGPATLVPGTAMPITLGAPQDRKDVIAYLASLKK